MTVGPAACAATSFSPLGQRCTKPFSHKCGYVRQLRCNDTINGLGSTCTKCQRLKLNVFNFWFRALRILRSALRDNLRLTRSARQGEKLTAVSEQRPPGYAYRSICDHGCQARRKPWLQRMHRAMGLARRQNDIEQDQAGTETAGAASWTLTSARKISRSRTWSPSRSA